MHSFGRVPRALSVSPSTVLHESRDVSLARFKSVLICTFACLSIGILLCFRNSMSPDASISRSITALACVVAGRTDLNELSFNYTRVIDDRAMEVLIQDVLPLINRWQSDSGWPRSFSFTLVGLTILYLICFLSIWASIAEECGIAELYGPTSYTLRVEWQRCYIIRAYAVGQCIFTVIYWISYFKIFDRWGLVDDSAPLLFVICAFTTLGMLIGSAVPIAVKWYGPLVTYTEEQLRFVGTVCLVLASGLLGISLAGWTSSEETIFLLAIQKVRDLFQDGVIGSEELVGPVMPLFKSSVLPGVASGMITTSPSDLDYHILICSFLLFLPSLQTVHLAPLPPGSPPNWHQQLHQAIKAVPVLGFVYFLTSEILLLVISYLKLGNHLPVHYQSAEDLDWVHHSLLWQSVVFPAVVGLLFAAWSAMRADRNKGVVEGWADMDDHVETAESCSGESDTVVEGESDADDEWESGSDGGYFDIYMRGGPLEVVLEGTNDLLLRAML